MCIIMHQIDRLTYVLDAQFQTGLFITGHKMFDIF